MSKLIARKLQKALRNVPNLLQGYNIYVNRDKLKLIDFTFTECMPHAHSFADLGGVWKVNAAYSIHAMNNPRMEKGVLVDTHVPSPLRAALGRFPDLQVIEGDFASKATVDLIGNIDVVFLFDVLLHQANPDWDDVLELYSPHCGCFVIYNQQFIRGNTTMRLTDLPFDEYIALVSDHAMEVTRYVYDHPTEIHPQYSKPWKDIHNITQWGITDEGLRKAMDRLGFREVFYRNYGMFIDLPAFENHAFVFTRS